MDKLIKMFASTHISSDIVQKIYINNQTDSNGYGIVFENFVLTPYHVIENSKIISVNNIEYNILLEIDEYDVAVLINKINTKQEDISYFLKFALYLSRRKLEPKIQLQTCFAFGFAAGHPPCPPKKRQGRTPIIADRSFLV
jgi:hypothetical protein